jgi:HAD superfamily hydrolase (TIGR01509 family)
MKLNPKAILFDMDGVLVDSIDSWWKALNHALETYNMQKISKEVFIEKYWGHDLYDNLKKNNLPIKVGKFCNKIYGEYLDGITIYPNTKEVLEKLSKYQKCIITNTPCDCTEQVLKTFDIAKFFDFVFTSDDVKLSKPNPEIVLLACKKLKVKTKDAVLIGDTNSDIKAGHAAGCKVIGLRIKADFFVKDISGLLEIL